jgi:hypothetical protein
VLNEDFNRYSGFSCEGIAELAKGPFFLMKLSSLREREQTWPLFQNPLLRFRNGELPPDDPDNNLQVKGKLGRPSVKVKKKKKKKKMVFYLPEVVRNLKPTHSHLID